MSPKSKKRNAKAPAVADERVVEHPNPLANPIPNPDIYAEMSVPFPSAEEAEAAMRAFFNDLRHIRRVHRIADVVCVPMVSYDPGDGDPAPARQYGVVSLGDTRLRLPLLNAAVGAEGAAQRRWGAVAADAVPA